MPDGGVASSPCDGVPAIVTLSDGQDNEHKIVFSMAWQ
ncbi:hypothetical protein COO91_10902 (plasmid) [Nostoc flagelliforme CCNUN1]|uniref:Uncharacterized protein n=1 Tax=Nostoc flagelliforme CCNUN1 TaxID=2038116 RepID=A0A2K8TAE8_9NOSO|nr:hypothetical protein COO91_10902 [Nostoc flagelliforme CCNUN1]